MKLVYRLRVFFVLLVALAAAGRARGAAARPNIVFILFDDLGWPQCPTFRAEADFRLPNMDRLAHGGMRFTDAHAAAAVCTPTRYGVMTGRYPMRIGQYGVLTTFSRPIIEPTRLTVASMMKDAGYHTACFGKWHLGMNIHAQGKATGNELPVGTRVSDGPVTRGFETYCGYPEARDIGLIIRDDKILGNYQPVDVQPLLAKMTIEYLEQQAKEKAPFFLYMPLSTPHTPVVPAPEYVGKGGSHDKQKGYGDWVYEGDAVLGQVLDALKRLNLSDNTLVLVSSDNGAAGRVYPPLRGCKTSIYEGGHREPFVAYWPGHIKAGSSCDDVICLNDLMATCADVAQVKLPGNAAEDSVSILPDLLGTATGPVREATIHQAPDGDLAIRQGPWKLVFKKGKTRELYNLQQDLGETHEVAAANVPVVTKLTALMQKYITDGRSTQGPALKNSVEIPLEGNRTKRKKDQSAAAAEVRLALDPGFD
jgi:arylsulfatase A-like enzyme